MALSDEIQQLEEKIAQAVERAVHQVRQGLEERLRESHEQLLGRLGQVAVELPARFLGEEDLQSVTAAAADAGDRGGVGRLHQALRELDGARSQREILHILARAAAGFASRTAIFLTRADTIEGWSADGFGDDTAVRALRLPRDGDDAWGRLLRGRGSVELDAGDRIDLSGRLEVEVPRRAVVIPLVLHDRLAAALYADEVAAGESLRLEPLQVLAYVAALALETLPFRQRSSTPTLRSFEEASGDEADLELWPAAPGAAVAEAPSEQPAPVAAAAPAGVEVEELPVPAAGETGQELEMATDIEDVDLEPVVAEPVAEETEAPAVEALAEPEETLDAAAGWQLEEEAAEATHAVADVPAPAPVAPEPAAPMEPEPMELEQLAPTAPPEVAPPPPSEPAEETHPAAVPEAAAAPPADRPRETSQVEPPTGVRGPGWAFTASPQMADDDEARHEQAKRLARLLVSEIKLYNEELIEQGRRDHNIYERLKEDIDRSRQLYEERVDERVRETSDYFYHELVRVLGGGDPKTLGIGSPR